MAHIHLSNYSRALLLMASLLAALTIGVAVCIGSLYWAWHENAGYLPGVPVRILQGPGGFDARLITQLDDGRDVLYITVPIIVNRSK